MSSSLPLFGFCRANMGDVKGEISYCPALPFPSTKVEVKVNANNNSLCLYGAPRSPLTLREASLLLKVKQPTHFWPFRRRRQPRLAHPPSRRRRRRCRRSRRSRRRRRPCGCCPSMQARATRVAVPSARCWCWSFRPSWP